MRHRTNWLVLLVLMAIAVAQGAELPAGRTVSGAQFTVAYPEGDGWEVSVARPGAVWQGFPYDDVEETIDFERGAYAEADGEPEYFYSLGIRRQWPSAIECLDRAQKPARPAKALQQLNAFYERARKEGNSELAVFDLRQCGNNAAGYAERYFAYQASLAAENAAMMGQKRAAVIDKGVVTIGGRVIYFARYEIGRSSDSSRSENASYLYFPPGFGKEHLFFYAASVMADCRSRSGCAELGDVTLPALAVLGSLVPRSGSAAPRLCSAQTNDSKYGCNKLTAEDAEEDQNFGGSVDMDNDTIAVLAGGNYRHRGKGGSAYVFARAAATQQWNQQAKLRMEGAEKKDWALGSIAIGGDTIVVTSFFSSTHVFLHDNETGRWSLQADLGIKGSSVDIDGNTIVVGATASKEYPGGAAYVFERNATTGQWSRPTILTASDSVVGGRFGRAVALDSETLVVSDGAGRIPGHGYIGNEPGSAYVFTRDALTGRWNQQAVLTASDPSPLEGFGSAVAIDANVIVIASQGPYMSRELSGSADVFVSDDSSSRWHHLQRLTSEDAITGNTFGSSVAIDGDIIAIGAENDTDPRDDSGAVYVYQREAVSGMWVKQAKLKAPDEAVEDNFGNAVAIHGGSLVVGSPNNDAKGNDSGCAYVFTLPTSDAASAMGRQ